MRRGRKLSTSSLREPGGLHERAKLSYIILPAEDLSLDESRIIRRTCFLKPLILYPLRTPLLNNPSNETLWIRVQKKNFSPLDSSEMRIFYIGCVSIEIYLYTHETFLYAEVFTYCIDHYFFDKKIKMSKLRGIVKFPSPNNTRTT